MKKTLYVLILIAAILAILWAPKPSSAPSTVSPTTAKATHEEPKPVATAPATTETNDKAMDADDVPAGAEVAPAPATNAPKSDNVTVPPSEGQ